MAGALESGYHDDLCASGAQERQEGDRGDQLLKKALSGRRAPDPKRVRVSEILHHNTAIIPAGQLKAIKEWQKKANQLSDGSVLLVLPAGNGRMEVVGRHIRFTLYRQGREVKITTIN